MPVYEIEHPKTGQKIRMEGDGVPSDADIREAFARVGTQPQRTVSGNLNASPAETERMRREFVAKEGTLGTRVKDTLKQAFDPSVQTPPADSATDFATRVVPQSLTQLVPRVAKGAYDAVRGQTDPLVESLSSLSPVGLPGPKMEANAMRSATGLAQAMAAPTGLMGLETAKDAWLSDPAGSALAVAPSLKMLGMGGKAAKNGVRSAVGTPEDLARSALKPYIGESVARQKQVTKGLTTAVEDKNASARMPKFMKRNLAEMEEIAGRQEVFLNEKGNPMVSIQGIREALKGTVDEARNTPGTADAAVSAADKVLEDITNHPAYDVATDSVPLNTVQTMKRNIWKKLRESGTFNKDATPGLQDAMWDAASGMNEIINKHVPEMAAENARYGELANVNKLLKRAVDRHANNNIIPLRSLIMLAKGDIGGFSQAASMWALDHPTFKLYIAQRMAKSRGGKTPSPKDVNSAIDGIKSELVQREQTVLDSESVPQSSRSNLGDTIPGGYQRAYSWEGKPTRKQMVENPEVLPGRGSQLGDRIPGAEYQTLNDLLAPYRPTPKRFDPNTGTMVEVTPPQFSRQPMDLPTGAPRYFDPSVGAETAVKPDVRPRSVQNLEPPPKRFYDKTVGAYTETAPRAMERKPINLPAREGAKAQAAKMTYKQFIAGKMGAYMKSEGGHAAAMKRIAKEWAEYKTKGE